MKQYSLDIPLINCLSCSEELNYKNIQPLGQCTKCKNTNSIPLGFHDYVKGPLDEYQLNSNKFYNVNASKYDSKWSDFEDWQIKLRLDFIEKAKIKDDKNALLVDLACGPGRDLAFFSKNGNYKVLGIDLSERQLFLAREKNPDQVLIRADIKNIPLLENTVDALWCCVALIHIERSELPQVLCGINRIMKPGAIAFFSFFQGEGTTKVKREIYGNLPEIWENYSSNECENLCVNAGFNIESIITRKAFSGRDTSAVTGGSKQYIDCFVRKN